ncbi:dienelactone hydrolase family protein [Protomyces lactucae-debilis]|uniref:Dienelactone hydrolase family protein n=1 Tax=Protomyces lactucae-debilis TaxID=2754530 RepID=A0A1Y2FIB4_PROLT|nr:dienelactone hydrolase family protein [Protomyces lactucae-debilis]ORY83692.1 dienelactone hydrolase family protein [Protomyces lactucae-debilis]
MLIQDSFVDVKTSSNDMRVHLFTPKLQNGSTAKFPALIVFSEIYQVTGPVKRLCRRLAGEGFLVASPCVFHESEGAREMRYDAEDTKLGNELKLTKKSEATDEDLRLTVDTLLALPQCNGRVGATGICYGGHLAFRAFKDPRVSAIVTFFGTDIHSGTLSPNGDDSLRLAKEGHIGKDVEMLLIFGKLDNHVPRDGRDLIRSTLDNAGVRFTWLELANAQHAFVRDEDEKGRYDPAITQCCISLALELFSRTICL